jgi:hypothetical protein
MKANIKKRANAKWQHAIKLTITIIIMAGSANVALAGDVAVPTGPDTFLIVNSSRYTGGVNGTTIYAEAGNVTALTIAESTATRAWAGYYGNITGNIVLSDGYNATLFNWAIANPSGEVYASNGSDVSWSQIRCVNFSGNITGGDPGGDRILDEPFNITTLHTFFGINTTDRDTFDQTFTSVFNDARSLQVGQKVINTSMRCPQAYMYVDGAAQSTSFKEILLHDNKSIIFAAIINDSVDGFQPGVNEVDFEMLVAENGHTGFEGALTPYYFYVELT